MGKRDRERRERRRAGERRVKKSGQPSAVERYRDLAVMSGCKEADEKRASLALIMGPSGDRLNARIAEPTLPFLTC